MRAQPAPVVVVRFPNGLRAAVRLGAFHRFRHRHQVGEREQFDAHLGRLVFDKQGVEVVALVTLPAIGRDVHDLLDPALLQFRSARGTRQVAVVELGTLIDVRGQPLAVQQQKAGGAVREGVALLLHQPCVCQQGGEGIVAAHHALGMRPVVERQYGIQAGGHAGAKGHRLRPRQVGNEEGFRGVGYLAQQVLLQRLAAAKRLLHARVHDRPYLRTQ